MKRVIQALGLAVFLLAGCSLLPETQPAPLRFANSSASVLGKWEADVEVSSRQWTASMPLQIQARLQLSDAIFAGFSEHNLKPDSVVLLVTAERTFDADGILRLPSDERMSTLLTPTGLAIEGGTQGAVTRRFGYGFRTPVDELVTLPVSAAVKTATGRQFTFNINTKLPDNLPPGIYRLRFDYGVAEGKRMQSLNDSPFARRGFAKTPCDSESYSPPIPANAKHVSGRFINADKIKPRLPWVLLDAYNSNGYRGVVAREDQAHFALSNRNIIPDDVILPRFDENNPKNVLAYNLEPRLLTDTIDDVQNIPWDDSKGELTISITGPDGKTTDLGSAPFAGKSGRWLTTKNTKFTQWRPPQYGHYSVKATGWMQDIWGNRYQGGGNYSFWIAKRMTLATATFQAQAYPVGNRYGRDMGFSPALPADVEVTASLLVNSDPKNVRTVHYSGKATSGGVFGAAQGLKPLMFDAPGEYTATVLAKYTDADGHLWVSSMRHAGVIYPANSPIVAHGKKLRVGKELLDRGDSNTEGWAELGTEVRKLEHIDFPYNSGDVLLIASEQEGANKIEPTLSWNKKDQPNAYDPAIQPIGMTNVRLNTSNGYSPHLFPEYITDWQYFYAGAPRPGFMGRFLVGETGVRAPYWPTSLNNFGGQINSTNNGDMPGDIYRLLGGVVIRNHGQAPQYAGYMANAFIIPKGSKNNRVIAPGEEDLLGPNGEKSRIFLAMNARPGMVYDVGTPFAPAFQIDPMLPVAMKFTLTYPDGHQVTTEGVGDDTGSFAGKERWNLDQPGLYRYRVSGRWQSHEAVVPGLPAEGGEFYVIEKERPIGAKGISFNLPPLSKYDPAKGVKFVGSTTAQSVRYAAIMPGMVLAQGSLPVKDGKFEYTFDPVAFNKKASTYEISNARTGKAEIGDVVHLTFFSEEAQPVKYHSFVRLIVRGNTVHYAR